MCSNKNKSGNRKGSLSQRTWKISGSVRIFLRTKNYTPKPSSSTQKQVNNWNKAPPFTMPILQRLRILGAVSLQVEELAKQRSSNTKIPYSLEHQTNRLPASSTRARDTKYLRWKRNLASWITSKRSITSNISKAKEIYLKTSSS